MVVLFHAQGESRTRGLADPFPDLTFGAFGVDLFFVVSGFITVFASRRLFGRLGGMLPFFARRLVRIAPLYWVFTALYAVIAVVFGRLPGHPQASATTSSRHFLILPSFRPKDGPTFQSVLRDGRSIVKGPPASSLPRRSACAAAVIVQRPSASRQPGPAGRSGPRRASATLPSRSTSPIP